MGAVATNFWVTRIKASAVTQTGKTNTVTAFITVHVGCSTGSRSENVFTLSEKMLFPSF